MKYIHLVLGLILALPSLASSQAGPALAEGLRLLEEGRTTLEEKPLMDAKNYFASLAQKDGPDNSSCFYPLAQANRYLAESYAMRNDTKNAGNALDEAIAAAQRSITLDGKSAGAHSLLADLYGRKISFGGFLAGMRYGSKVDSENKQAQALDANNARVYASLGRQYLHAPSMFGGDVDKAIASFRQSTQLEPNFDETYVWLAIAYRKKGDTANATNALQQALRLNPRSVFAKRALSGE